MRPSFLKEKRGVPLRRILTVEVWLPYGKTEVCVTVPQDNFLGTLEAPKPPSPPDPLQTVRSALENPLEGVRLGEIVKGRREVAISVDIEGDPPLNGVMVRALLERLGEAGISEGNIKIFAGNSSSKPLSENEIRKHLGDDVPRAIPLIFPDEKSNEEVEVGLTNRRVHVHVNKAYLETDFKIATGQMAPHPLTGLWGGPWSLLGAVAGAKTLKPLLASSTDLTPKHTHPLNNPAQGDAVEAMEFLRVDYMLNVIVTSKTELLGALAGSPKALVEEGRRLAEGFFNVPVEERGEVVVVGAGGHPQDDTFPSASKALPNALSILKENGVIILLAECASGFGEGEFRKVLKCRNLEEAREEAKRNPTPAAYEALQLLQLCERERMVLVSALPDYLVSTGGLRLKQAKSLNDAVEAAFRMAGKRAKVWILPSGGDTLPYLRSPERSQPPTNP